MGGDSDNLPKDYPKVYKDEDRALREAIPAGLQHNIGFLLNRNARNLRDDLGQALTPLQLSVHEYAIMRIIELGQADTQQGVAERYGIDSSTMVEIVDRLEGREILKREKNPQDRRSYTLVLTPKGRKTLSRGKRIAESVHKKFLSPLDDVTREILYDSLAKLISSRGQGLIALLVIVVLSAAPALSHDAHAVADSAYRTDKTYVPE